MPKKTSHKAKNPAAVSLGAKGGRANARKGKRHMSEIGMQGAIARWGDKKKLHGKNSKDA